MIGIPATGGTSVFVPMFDPEPVMAAIESHAVDWTLMVPTMIAMVLDHPRFRPERLASLRDLVYGASPMPPELLDRLLRTFPDLGVWQGYGMTESSSVLTMLTDRDHRRGDRVLHSAGRPVLGVEVSVRRPDGTHCPTGSDGEVWARGGNLFREYWHRPEQTAEALVDGWYRTGDLGHLDAEGYLYLVDRVHDLIVTGGENVYSLEVENVLASHPAVAEVAVIGIPHEVWGEAVHAIVVLRPGPAPSADELIAWAHDRLSPYKVPKSVEFRAEPLPLSGALKPLKRELRAPYWAGRVSAVH